LEVADASYPYVAWYVRFSDGYVGTTSKFNGFGAAEGKKCPKMGQISGVLTSRAMADLVDFPCHGRPDPATERGCRGSKPPVHFRPKPGQPVRFHRSEADFL
jgi:hypothetical protein